MNVMVTGRAGFIEEDCIHYGKTSYGVYRKTVVERKVRC